MVQNNLFPRFDLKGRQTDSRSIPPNKSLARLTTPDSSVARPDERAIVDGSHKRHRNEFHPEFLDISGMISVNQEFDYTASGNFFGHCEWIQA